MKQATPDVDCICKCIMMSAKSSQRNGFLSFSQYAQHQPCWSSYPFIDECSSLASTSFAVAVSPGVAIRHITSSLAPTFSAWRHTSKLWMLPTPGHDHRVCAGLRRDRTAHSHTHVVEILTRGRRRILRAPIQQAPPEINGRQGVARSRATSLENASWCATTLE